VALGAENCIRRREPSRGSGAPTRTTPSWSNSPPTVYAGREAARLIGVPYLDPRAPDVIGIAEHGVVYTGGTAKIAEHGGDDLQDRNVPVLVSLPGEGAGHVFADPVETTQIAPSILGLLGLNPNALDAVRIEHTHVLPGLFGFTDR
jgi:hypothetical protein